MAPGRVLEQAACWQRLSTVDVGRLAVEHGREPDIFPVNFLVDGTTLVVRTSPGAKVTALKLNPIVAFEADGYDADAAEFWSVVVKARSQVVHAGSRLAYALLLPLHPLADVPDPVVVVRLHPATVTGRAFAASPGTTHRLGMGQDESGTRQRTVVPPPGVVRNSTSPP